ncbi:MAG: PAS domain-containing protein [Candidatus Roizmanbacteria bacterium]
MINSFVFLSIQTLILWFLVILFHRQKKRYTLIPLYSYIAVLTLLTHNLSDLGFAVIENQWFFLISSFSFFTALMLGILFLYLFEGPRATRIALIVILYTSILYIGIVVLLHFQVDTSKWVQPSFERFKYYFWSILAIILDVLFISIVWELFAKVKRMPLVLRIFLVIFGMYLVDTLVFVTGVFGSKDIYFSILQSDVVIRFVLALIVTPIAHFYLKSKGYLEETRDKPNSMWEIFNFRSDLEVKIKTMEEMLKWEKEMQIKLEESKETYLLALEGTNAGIFDWDIDNKEINYSAKFCNLLGYEEGQLSKEIDVFLHISHPDDYEKTTNHVNDCFEHKRNIYIEHRLKLKDGGFKWFLSSGVIKYSASGKPVRVVGSIIDINDRKLLNESFQEKVKELEEINKMMVDRELKMIELKEELKKLKS